MLILAVAAAAVLTLAAYLRMREYVDDAPLWIHTAIAASDIIVLAGAASGDAVLAAAGTAALAALAIIAKRLH